jgi:hypothetical protein
MSLRMLGFVVATMAATPVLAQADAYARHWAVQVDAPGVYAIELSPALYLQVQRADLGDLAAFNGAGEALAFGPLAPASPRAEPQWRDAPWFVLPTPAAGASDDLNLQVLRTADGAIRLRADLGAGESAPTSGDVLIDTGIDPEARLRLQALSLDFAASAADFSAQLQVDASDDLSDWRLSVAHASVLRVRQGGQTLQRRRIDLPGMVARYLRLRSSEPGALPLSGVQVATLAQDTPDPRPDRVLAAEWVGRDGDAWLYRLPARIPAAQVNLRLAQDNAVVRAELSSREHAQDRWQPRGGLMAFRLRAAGVTLDNEPLALNPNRDREWRLNTDIALQTPPQLEFAYQPERWLLLTQGAAPYVIAAGSNRARRDAPPLSALLAPLRIKYGDDWQPPQAALGAPVLAAGTVALAPSARERWSDRALWLLLIGAALAIGWMVVRLLRERPPPA